MNYWLLKTEPDVFSYQDLVRLGKDMWDGVRSFQAVKYLKQMEPGDQAFIYHTGKQRIIVGVAQVVSHPYPDPTADSKRWVVVDLVPKYQLNHAVSLKEIKADSRFSRWELVRLSRLSVMPVLPEYWEIVLNLATEKQ